MQDLKAKIAAVVESLPGAYNPGREDKFAGPPPDQAEKAITAVLEGGKDGVRTLLALVHDPTGLKFKNFKAEYLLHAVCVYVCSPGREAHRTMVAEVLCSQIGESNPSLWRRGCFIRELHVMAGKEAVAALGEQLLNEDLCETAAQALLAIGDGAAAQFRTALPRVRGKSQLTIVQALGVLRDAESLGALKAAAASPKREIRMAAVWGLGNIGDASAADVVIKATGAEGREEQVQAVKACLILAEKLMAAGKKDQARRIYLYLRDTRGEPCDAYIREAAEKAL